MSLLNDRNFYQVRVSSVLNKDVQNCGKQFMFDNNEETCWCSDQGSPQWIAIAFQKETEINGLEIQFQGGFVGEVCQIIFNNNSLKEYIDFYPEDHNKLQKFEFSSKTCNKITIHFQSSTDFFGRIIVYKLNILGK